jgi:hypothetical protein
MDEDGRSSCLYRLGLVSKLPREKCIYLLKSCMTGVRINDMDVLLHSDDLIT